MPRLLVIAVVSVIFAACSPMSRLPTVDPNLAASERDKQLDMAWRENVRRTTRLGIVSWRIAEANSEACKDRLKYRIGASIQTEFGMPKEYRATWRRIYGAHDVGAVMYVTPGGPAATAGLVAGDVVEEVNGASVSGEEGTKAMFSALAEDSSAPKTIKVRRAAQTEVLTLMPRQVCNYPASIMPGDSVNAYADGDKIFVTNGMMRFAETDEELALVVAHEMAHNTQEHMKAQTGNRLIGALVGALVSVAVRADVSQIGANIGQGAYSKEFEAEADYVGTYYAARAGFNVDRAADFWRRMAVEHPAAIGHGSSHPDTASRFVAIEAAVKEVAGKRAAGTALWPEKKP